MSNWIQYFSHILATCVPGQGGSSRHEGLSRKQREQLDKDAAKRRYEELHKAGKTDECAKSP